MITGDLTNVISYRESLSKRSFWLSELIRTRKRVRFMCQQKPRILSLGIALSALLTLSGCVSEIAPVSTDNEYFAVIDAGSSGSRIYLYEGIATKDKLVVNALLEFEIDEIPGLSTFVEQPNLAGEDGIGPLINKLGQTLTAENISRENVPVYVLATAGMRNAETTNPDVISAIYADVSDFITAQGFEAAEVETISGKREAVYAWADVNFSSGVFTGKAKPIGIVEVGGASSQIAFPTQTSGINTVSLSIRDTEYQVFGVSYLGMGVNDARAGILTETDAIAGSPCFPNNSVGAEPVTYDKKNSIPIAASVSNFDFSHCAELYSSYLDTAAQRPVNLDGSGGLIPQQISSIDGFSSSNFVGLSAINFTIEDFNLGSTTDESTELHNTVNKLCAGPDAWSAVAQLFEGEVSSFSENACANGTYTHTWVFSPHGLGLNSEQLTAVGEVGGNSPTWTRGFALLELTSNKVN